MKNERIDTHSTLSTSSTMTMRALKIMRYGRRTTSTTTSDLSPSMNHSFSSTSPCRRQSSLSSASPEQHLDSWPINDNETPVGLRGSPRTSTDDVSSRQSAESGELSQPQTNLRNFYVFFFLLFVFLLLSVVYSFIRMMKSTE